MTNSRLALFADCLLVGLLTAIASIPIVTAYPAFLAACATIRQGSRYFPQFVLVVRSGLMVWIAPSLVVAVLALDAIAVAAGVPGSAVLSVLLAAAAIALGVLALRAAALWRPGLACGQVIRLAASQATTDPGGSVLLLLAGLATAAIAVFVPVTALFLSGFLALAAVAVGSRATQPKEVAT